MIIDEYEYARALDMEIVEKKDDNRRPGTRLMRAFHGDSTVLRRLRETQDWLARCRFARRAAFRLRYVRMRRFQLPARLASPRCRSAGFGSDSQRYGKCCVSDRAL